MRSPVWMKASTGMPGTSLTIAEPLDLFGGHGDADDVIALAGALVVGGVGGDPRDGAVDLRRGALVERGEPQHDGLAELDLIDVLGIDLDLDQERCRPPARSA